MRIDRVEQVDVDGVGVVTEVFYTVGEDNPSPQSGSVLLNPADPADDGFKDPLPEVDMVAIVESVVDVDEMLAASEVVPDDGEP